MSHSSLSHHFHVNMSNPSHSHHFHFHINICCPSHDEPLKPHPTSAATTTTTTLPHNDQNPQTQETPNQQQPQLVLHHHQQQQCSENSGMVASINYASPITHADVSIPAKTPLTLPTHPPLKGCLHNVSKKCKLDVRKQQAIEKKCRILMEKFNPVPFVPSENLDFSKHEKVSKRLGLWDFVHMEFDRSVRVDLVAELVASYDSKSRCSYVNGTRIAVNRADLARVVKLPMKKGGGVELDLEELTEDSIGFIKDFMSSWVLLHDDTWMMPAEVLNWTKMIKDGHPEKLDWAGLFWFMVKKELTQGVQLRDCYYASHLQCLIKSQCEELFLEGEAEKVEFDADVREEEEGVPSQGPDIELTLGQNGGENEQVKDADKILGEDSRDKSSMELLVSTSDTHHANSAGPLFHDNGGKRVLGDENQSLYGSNKRLRIDKECDDKASDEVQKQDNVIDLDRLHKTCCEEIQQRDEEILCLKRELNRMKNLVECYREASDEADKILAEFKQCYELPNHPIAKDARPGGITPIATEKEGQRLKQEEEHR